MNIETQAEAYARINRLMVAKAAADRTAREEADATADRILNLGTVEHVELWTGPYGRPMHSNRYGRLS